MVTRISISLSELASVVCEYAREWEKTEESVNLPSNKILISHTIGTLQRLGAVSCNTLTPAWIVLAAWSKLYPTMAIVDVVLEDLGIQPLAIEVQEDSDMVFIDSIEKPSVNETSMEELREDPEALAQFVQTISGALCNSQSTPQTL